METGLLTMISGLALALCGVVYQRYPNIFRRGIWLKTSIAIRTMTPEAYALYIKKIGRLYVTIGVVLFGVGMVKMLLVLAAAISRR